MTAAIRVLPADAGQKPVIAQLIQLYLHDMTEHLPFPIGADGLFEYDYLDRFWQHPYLIYAGDELAGFALVIDNCPVTGAAPCWFMAEFFVLRAHRGQGVGRAATGAILSRHPGLWHLATIDRNKPAAAFWDRIAAGQGAAAIPHNFDGEVWTVRELTV